jgi:hypothetical protein
MVRSRRLELPREINPTATSTLRVYQFRHDREIEGLPISKGFPLQGENTRG